MASISKRPDGRWRARYRDSAGKEHAAHRATKAAAQSWLDENTAGLVRRDWVDPGRARLTVGVWGAQWLAGRVDLKPKTTAGYENLWKTQIKPTWEHVQLATVTNGDVAKWVAAMRSKLSSSRTRQAYHVFSAMLADAVKDRRLASNPAAGIKLPRMPRPDDKYLTHEELDAIAKGVRPVRDAGARARLHRPAVG